MTGSLPIEKKKPTQAIKLKIGFASETMVLPSLAERRGTVVQLTGKRSAFFFLTVSSLSRV